MEFGGWNIWRGCEKCGLGKSRWKRGQIKKKGRQEKKSGTLGCREENDKGLKEFGTG